MTFWTAVLLICWMEAGVLDCYTWSGGLWETRTNCIRAVSAVTMRSAPDYVLARCEPQIKT